MNPEQNNNIDNTQTNTGNNQSFLENTQTILDNTQVNILNGQNNLENTQQVNVEQPVNNNPSVENAEATQPAQASTPQNNNAVQPSITPTVSTVAPEDNTIVVEEKKHPVPISDDKNKKDFVIKSKKETVAEEVKKREAIIEEHVKKANENYKPNSKFTNILLISFLVFIIAFTIFLPEIHDLSVKLFDGSLNAEEEVKKITTGALKCTHSNSSGTLDYEYEYNFKFSKNLLESFDRTTYVKGDPSLDKDALDNIKENCNKMKTLAENISGISVNCDSESNSSRTIQIYDLSSYKADEVTKEYTEAGGDYPDFNYEHDMDEVEKNMNANGYTCKRFAS